MTPQQTGLILGKCAGYDQRTVGAADVAAWHEIIGHLDTEDCLHAVTEHYTHETRRAMPADIRTLAIGIRDRRKGRETQDTQRRAIEAAIPDRSPEVKQLIADLAASLPQPDIRQRALARARAERGRPYKPLAKTSKGKSKPKTPSYPPPANDEIAKLAMRYLVDGHTPADVSERLAISRKWCEKTATQFAKKDAA